MTELRDYVGANQQPQQEFNPQSHEPAPEEATEEAPAAGGSALGPMDAGPQTRRFRGVSRLPGGKGSALVGDEWYDVAPEDFEAIRGLPRGAIDVAPGPDGMLQIGTGDRRFNVRSARGTVIPGEQLLRPDAGQPAQRQPAARRPRGPGIAYPPAIAPLRERQRASRAPGGNVIDVFHPPQQQPAQQRQPAWAGLGQRDPRAMRQAQQIIAYVEQQGGTPADARALLDQVFGG
jgi:hypothetical protein